MTPTPTPSNFQPTHKTQSLAQIGNMEKVVLLLNGPNLNLLGTRETHLYGQTTLATIEEKVVKFLNNHQIACQPFQSNAEGAMIDWLHAHKTADFLILNPAAYTHTSVALRDAILGINIPFIEIHLSNVHKREPFRHHSYFSDIALGCVVGLGLQGYEFAARAAVEHLK